MWGLAVFKHAKNASDLHFLCGPSLTTGRPTEHFFGLRKKSSGEYHPRRPHVGPRTGLLAFQLTRGNETHGSPSPFPLWSERTPMTVIVVATIYPEPKHRAEVITALESTIARVHAEDEGCELYALHEGEDRLVMIEKWSSPDTLTAHGKGDAFAELSKQLEGKLA